MHIGSQLTTLDPYRDAIAKVRDLIRQLRADGHRIDRFDIGGGLGIVYADEKPPSIAEFMQLVRKETDGLGCELTFEPGRRYALVLMLDVLEHFPDPAVRLKRAVELLAPGGAIVLTVPAFLSLWTSHDELNRHFTRFTRKRLAAAAREAGARIETSQYFFHWMFPVKLAAHLREAVRPAPPTPPRIPPPWLNGLLYRVSRCEQAAARLWAPPFGNSLLAVLRRA